MSGDWPTGVARIILPEVDSTNAEAARIAPSLPGPTWILALRQTAGRGRRGRAWTDPEGNFAASYLCRPLGTPDEAALRSFVAALALYDALVAATGRAELFALKWPNDVLLNGGKLAGILLESLGRGAQTGHLAIGIGVNLRATPLTEEGAVPPVSLKGETGIGIAPEAFLDLIAPAFAHWEGQLVTYGFAPVRTAWMSRAARIGQPMLARTVTEAHEGIFEGIDATGALILRGPRGVRNIAAADIYFT